MYSTCIHTGQEVADSDMGYAIFSPYVALNQPLNDTLRHTGQEVADSDMGYAPETNNFTKYSYFILQPFF